MVGAILDVYLLGCFWVQLIGKNVLSELLFACSILMPLSLCLEDPNIKQTLD